MKKSSWIAVILILVVLAALSLSKASNQPEPTNEEQIHALLVKGETAIEQKDLKAAMSCVSRGYLDGSGGKYDALRIQAIQAFQQDEPYDVVLENTLVSVSGDEADVSASVTISLITQSGMHRVFSNPLRIHLAKESARQWLVFRAKSWKITRIDGAALDIEGQASGGFRD